MDFPIPPECIHEQDSHESLSAIEDFFHYIIDYLGYDELGVQAFARVSHHSLTLNTEPASNARQLTDSELSLLFVRDRPVASALRWRDDMNWTYTVFAVYFGPADVDALQQPIREA